jgi:hypothetical protein
MQDADPVFFLLQRGTGNPLHFPISPLRAPDLEGSRGSLIPVAAPPRGLLASPPTTSRPCRDDLQGEAEEGHAGAGEEREDDECGGRGAPAAAPRPRLDEQGKEHAEMAAPPRPRRAGPILSPARRSSRAAPPQCRMLSRGERGGVPRRASEELAAACRARPSPPLSCM